MSPVVRFVLLFFTATIVALAAAPPVDIPGWVAALIAAGGVGAAALQLSPLWTFVGEGNQRAVRSKVNKRGAIKRKHPLPKKPSPGPRSTSFMYARMAAAALAVAVVFVSLSVSPAGAAPGKVRVMPPGTQIAGKKVIPVTSAAVGDIARRAYLKSSPAATSARARAAAHYLGTGALPEFGQFNYQASTANPICDTGYGGCGPGATYNNYQCNDASGSPTMSTLVANTQTAESYWTSTQYSPPYYNAAGYYEAPAVLHDAAAAMGLTNTYYAFELAFGVPYGPAGWRGSPTGPGGYNVFWIGTTNTLCNGNGFIRTAVRVYDRQYHRYCEYFGRYFSSNGVYPFALNQSITRQNCQWF